MKLPAIGSTAPDFTLPSTSGSDVTLSGLRGRNVLLAFFPAAFTGVCTAEMCAFSEDYDAFASKDTVVLPVSVDHVASLQEFKRKERLAVDLLSDFKRNASRAYGTLNEEYFLLHPEEVVRRTQLLEKVWDMHFDPESNVVDVHVGNLRRKLMLACGGQLIQTVRGVGFSLRQLNDTKEAPLVRTAQTA